MPDYTITEKDNLYRRIPYKPNYWKEINGIKTPSSFAFKTKPNEDGLSVNIASLTTIENTVMDSQLFGIARFPAAIPLELGYKCKHDPKPDNNAHALILGNTNKIAKKLSTAAIQVF